MNGYYTFHILFLLPEFLLNVMVGTFYSGILHSNLTALYSLDISNIEDEKSLRSTSSISN